MRAEDPDRIRLYLAEHEGDLVAATTMVRVGEHAWYSYGASSTAKREVRGSNAVQWPMLRDAKAAGATVYDLRGITDTLSEDDPHFGLIQFKLGTGGEAVEYLGEWDLPLNKVLFKAFDLYMDAARMRTAMTFTLYVDEHRWRAHLRATVAATPGIVPVIKGNGYGLGNERLAAEAALLGVDTVAVGTTDELPAVQRGVPRRRAGADAVVPAPVRRPDRAGRADRRAPGDAAGRRRRAGAWSRR